MTYTTVAPWIVTDDTGALRAVAAGARWHRRSEGEARIRMLGTSHDVAC